MNLLATPEWEPHPYRAERGDPGRISQSFGGCAHPSFAGGGGLGNLRRHPGCSRRRAWNRRVPGGLHRGPPGPGHAPGGSVVRGVWSASGGGGGGKLGRPAPGPGPGGHRRMKGGQEEGVANFVSDDPANPIRSGGDQTRRKLRGRGTGAPGATQGHSGGTTPGADRPCPSHPGQVGQIGCGNVAVDCRVQDGRRRGYDWRGRGGRCRGDRCRGGGRDHPRSRDSGGRCRDGRGNGRGRPDRGGGGRGDSGGRGNGRGRNKGHRQDTDRGHRHVTTGCRGSAAGQDQGWVAAGLPYVVWSSGTFLLGWGLLGWGLNAASHLIGHLTPR